MRVFGHLPTFNPRTVELHESNLIVSNVLLMVFVVFAVLLVVRGIEPPPPSPYPVRALPRPFALHHHRLTSACGCACARPQLNFTVAYMQGAYDAIRDNASWRWTKMQAMLLLKMEDRESGGQDQDEEDALNCATDVRLAPWHSRVQPCRFKCASPACLYIVFVAVLCLYAGLLAAVYSTLGSGPTYVLACLWLPFLLAFAVSLPCCFKRFARPPRSSAR